MISLCLATHERAFLLAPTLQAIACQTRLPDEIIVSDSSQTLETEHVTNSFQINNPHIRVIHSKSDCKALPWHRWNGFQQSAGDIILFLDDDILLTPDALEMLERTYTELDNQYGLDQIAGVGFYTFLDDGTEKLRQPNSFEERWLGIADRPSASITLGGIGVYPKGMPKDQLVEVERLSGGRMSFRRSVLEQVGYLENLNDLFNRRIGPSEDTVISFYARKYGRLFMLTHHLAIHPNDERAVHTVDVKGGWNKGVMETWGRAHTMRWMATDLNAYKIEWARVASLEILRSVWWGILRSPIKIDSWLRLVGALYGTFLGILFWKTIPASAKNISENR